MIKHANYSSNLALENYMIKHANYSSNLALWVFGTSSYLDMLALCFFFYYYYCDKILFL
jgi:hypothetical protein